MKFKKRLYFSVIPEWKGRYVDFSSLVDQIEIIKASVVRLAKSYTQVKVLIGDNEPIRIDIGSVKEEQKLWIMVEENLKKVNDFYNALLKEFIERFHILTYQAIQLNLIEEFVPFTRGMSTQLQREFQRLRLSDAINLSSTQDLKYRKFLNQKGNNRLISLNRYSRIEDVIEQLNKMSGDQQEFDATEQQTEGNIRPSKRSHHPFSEGNNHHTSRSVPEGRENNEFLAVSKNRRIHKQSDFRLPSIEVSSELNAASPQLTDATGAPPFGVRSSTSNPIQTDSHEDDHARYNFKDERKMTPSANGKSGANNSASRVCADGESDLFTRAESDDWTDNKNVALRSKADMSATADESVKSEDSGYVSGGSEDGLFDEGGGEAEGNDEVLERDVILEGTGLSRDHRAPEIEMRQFGGDDRVRGRKSSPSLTGHSSSEKRSNFVASAAVSNTNLNTFENVPDDMIDDDDISLNVNDDTEEVTIGLRAPQRRGRAKSTDTSDKGPSGEEDPDVLQKTVFEPLPDLEKINYRKATEALRVAYSEMYRGLYLLKSFVDINLQAIEKLAIKHEKHIACGTRVKFHQEILPKYAFYRPRELRNLIRETEHVYSCAFTNGHRTEAMQKLRVPKDKKGNFGMVTLHFGFLLGVTLGLMIIIIYLYTIMGNLVLDKLQPGFAIFLTLAFAIVMLWYWGIDMYIWSHYRVNYIFIFGFNSRGHLRHQDIFDAAAIFSVILVLMMILYIATVFQLYDSQFRIAGFSWLVKVAPDVFPFMSVFLAITVFWFYSVKSQFWLIRTLCRIFAAPLYPVLFKDFFLADQLISLAIISADLDFVICYTVTSAFRNKDHNCASYFLLQVSLNVLPYMWRFLQCLRRYRDGTDKKTHLCNAGKYAVGAIACALAYTYLFNSAAWTISWYVVLAIATAYSYIWDVCKDWSIGNLHSKNWLLRDQLLYPKPWYYSAMILDLIMRCLWTLNIQESSTMILFHLNKSWSKKILTFIEVTRRAMWNIFRLENEQLNNCGEFRAFRDLPLPLPLSPEAESQLFQRED